MLQSRDTIPLPAPSGVVKDTPFTELLLLLYKRKREDKPVRRKLCDSMLGIRNLDYV